MAYQGWWTEQVCNFKSIPLLHQRISFQEISKCNVTHNRKWTMVIHCTNDSYIVQWHLWTSLRQIIQDHGKIFIFVDRIKCKKQKIIIINKKPSTFRPQLLQKRLVHSNLIIFNNAFFYFYLMLIQHKQGMLAQRAPDNRWKLKARTFYRTVNCSWWGSRVPVLNILHHLIM